MTLVVDAVPGVLSFSVFLIVGIDVGPLTLPDLLLVALVPSVALFLIALVVGLLVLPNLLFVALVVGVSMHVFGALIAKRLVQVRVEPRQRLKGGPARADKLGMWALARCYRASAHGRSIGTVPGGSYDPFGRGYDGLRSERLREPPKSSPPAVCE